jgi:hypothetical protein
MKDRQYDRQNEKRTNMVRKTMRIWSNKIVVIVSLHKCSALSWLLDVLVDGSKKGYIYNKLVLCIWPVVSDLDYY